MESDTLLKTLISLEIERGGYVVEKKDHKWTSHQKPHGSVTIWIETESGAVMALG
jgi:hypothetical protein